MADTPKNKNSAEDTKWDAKADAPSIGRPPASTIPQQTPTHPQNKNPKNKRRWTNDPPMFFVTLAGVIAVFAYTSVAAWQAYLTGGQLEEMRRAYGPVKIAADAAQKSAEAAERTLTELERPYIFLKIPEFVPSPYPNMPPRVKYVLKNYGRTPAIVRRVYAFTKAAAEPAAKWVEIFNGTVTLGVGEERDFELHGTGDFYPFPRDNSIGKPERTPLLRVEVTYSDVFDYFHLSGFTYFENDGAFHELGGQNYSRRKSTKFPPGVDWTPAWGAQP